MTAGTITPQQLFEALRSDDAIDLAVYRKALLSQWDIAKSVPNGAATFAEALKQAKPEPLKSFIKDFLSNNDQSPTSGLLPYPPALIGVLLEALVGPAPETSAPEAPENKIQTFLRAFIAPESGEFKLDAGRTADNLQLLFTMLTETQTPDANLGDLVDLITQKLHSGTFADGISASPANVILGVVNTYKVAQFLKLDATPLKDNPLFMKILRNVLAGESRDEGGRDGVTNATSRSFDVMNLATALGFSDARKMLDLQPTPAHEAANGPSDMARVIAMITAPKAIATATDADQATATDADQAAAATADHNAATPAESPTN
jgi:hypothetical protein